MSKGKNASKDTKKAPSTEGKKAPSDYQTGKTTVSKIELAPTKKKK